MRKIGLGFVLAAMSIGTPAFAAATITYDLTSASGRTATATGNAGNGNTITLSSLLYRVAPTSLTSTSQFVSSDNSGNAATLVFGSSGVSITTGLETDADEINQIDTQGGTNELLKLSFTGMQQLVSAVFNYVDADDTLRIYGSNGNSSALTYLGFDGEFYTTPGTTHTMGTGTSGATATTTDPSGTLTDANSFTVVFSKLPVYDNYYFTSNNDSGDGYRLSAVTVAAVPEPATWAMMALGFGAIGMALRARKVRTSAMSD